MGKYGDWGSYYSYSAPVASEPTPVASDTSSYVAPAPAETNPQTADFAGPGTAAANPAYVPSYNPISDSSSQGGIPSSQFAGANPYAGDTSNLMEYFNIPQSGGAASGSSGSPQSLTSASSTSPTLDAPVSPATYGGPSRQLGGVVSGATAGSDNLDAQIDRNNPVKLGAAQGNAASSDIGAAATPFAAKTGYQDGYRNPALSNDPAGIYPLWNPKKKTSDETSSGSVTIPDQTVANYGHTVTDVAPSAAPQTTGMSTQDVNKALSGTGNSGAQTTGSGSSLADKVSNAVLGSVANPGTNLTTSVPAYAAASQDMAAVSDNSLRNLPSSDPSKASGSPDGKSGLGDIGSLLSGAASAAKSLMPAAGIGTMGAAMAQGNKPIAGQDAVKSTADTASATANSLLSAYKSGTLPAGMQQAFQTQADAQKNGIRAQMAARGMTGSTTEQAALEAVDQQMAAAVAAQLTSMLNSALGYNAQAGSGYQNVLSTNLQQSDALTQAMASFAGSLVNAGNAQKSVTQ